MSYSDSSTGLPESVFNSQDLSVEDELTAHAFEELMEKVSELKEEIDPETVARAVKEVHIEVNEERI